MMRILITGVGAIIGYGIINSIKEIQQQHSIRIIGMDIYNDAYGRFIVDKFYKAENASSPKYLDFMNKIIKEESVDLIIPGIEQDMYRLHQVKNHVNTKIVLNNDLLIGLSKDKWNTYLYFVENTDIELIQTIPSNSSFEQCIDTLGVPFIMKPRSSYASKGLHIIDNKKSFDFYNEQNRFNNIFQKITGTVESEYTVSLFGDGIGGFYDYIILKRTLAQTGATDKASVIQKDDDIINYVSEICRLTKPEGPTNIQIRKEGDKCFLLEINPRISSACSLRTMANYNEPLMCILHYLQKGNINPLPKKSMHFIRYIKDFGYEQ